MKCRSCGNEIKEGENFCSKCGANISESVTNNKTSNNIIKVGRIIGIIILLFVMFYILKDNLGLFVGYAEYEKIAQNYVEQTPYSSNMVLIDTSSYSLDKEIRVRLRYRFVEGPNTSYITYIIAVDKDSKEVVGFSQTN